MPSGVEGMAPSDALESHPAPFEKAVLLDRFQRVLAAGGREAACWRNPLGCSLIESD